VGESVRSFLVESIIEDQFPLVLTRVEEIDFKRILTNNSRYRIKPEIFSEIYHLLLDEIEQKVTSGDPLFMSKLARHLPSMEPESYSLPAHRVKMLFSPGVRRHLFMDHGQFGNKLRASEKLQTAMKSGSSPLTVLEAFDELAFAIQRFEVISRLRHAIHLLPTSMTEDGLREEYRSSRVYRFTESVEVVGDAVDATVMFLDLRGFTETSEGMVSERDLTRQLYTVFDPFVEIISQFGGTVDKFLGDGMMVTFGAVHSSRKGPLNAIRTAIQLQDKIRELREEEKTHFAMGVSIHYGRVYLAHFIGSSGGHDTTVIGRNVNMAGRLSSASKRPKKEDGQAIEEDLEAAFDVLETDPSSTMRVTVGSDGMLFNEGIAVSRETVLALEKLLPLTRQEAVDDVYGEFYDTTIKKRIVLRHVGDAKFKGVWGSFPVYSVEYS
jgi:class 3 adenylate cyclase